MNLVHSAPLTLNIQNDCLFYWSISILHEFWVKK